MRERAGKVVAVVVACVAFLLPLAFMISGSLRRILVIPDRFEWFPSPLVWSNYQTIFDFVPLWTYMRNSVVVVVLAVPITVLIASWAGFAIATAPRRAQRRLVVLSVVTLMVPLSALWVPRFVMFRWAGLVDSFVPVVAPALMGTTPFYVLIFALAYSRIPKELYEAARVDGLSPLAVWQKVAFPLARPAAFAVAVLAFVWHWSNFIDPLLYLTSSSKYTLPLGLRSLQVLEPSLYPLFLAAAVLVTVPAVIAFLAAQRAFFEKTLDV